MDKIRITAAKWSIDSEGAWLSLQAKNPAEARALCESIRPGKEYTAEVKQYRQKRSKNANDLLWELCTQISIALAKDKVIKSKEDIYRDHIKRAGKCDFIACIERAADEIMTTWNHKGIGWFAEKVDDCKIPGCVKLCLYYGSSTYTTDEMSRLLDSVIQEAEDYGVEIISPSDLALIKEEWA